MALTNADVLRLRNRVNNLSSRINSFYSSLGGANPSASQVSSVQQEAIIAVSHIDEVLRIIEITNQQVRLGEELAEFRS